MTPHDDPDLGPVARFQEAFARARAGEAHDATAMTLATVSAEGRPSARVVLLKDADARGFTFYTNRESRKARELAANPFASLVIHWPSRAEQVRIEGRVERVSDEESDAYFATRARGSQIGAWASQQSRELASREALIQAVSAIEARFPGVVPRPPFWGGYRVVPARIEFWYGRDDRLHDRVVYARAGEDEGWAITRLYP
ncbi:MAG: pyridoxamine 5'-phosphate oxidase [Minicystis sp.]